MAAIDEGKNIGTEHIHRTRLLCQMENCTRAALWLARPPLWGLRFMTWITFSKENFVNIPI